MTKTKKAQKPSHKTMTPKEVEGMISMQKAPDDALVNVQKDLTRVFDKLIEDAGIELPREPLEVGIGRDRA